MALQLARYAGRGLNTIEKIINTWAPGSENNTGAYIAALSRQLGVAPDAALNLGNPQLMASLMGGIIQHENGRNPYSSELIDRAALAGIGGKSLQQETTIWRKRSGDHRHGYCRQADRCQRPLDWAIHAEGLLMDILSTLFSQPSRKIGLLVPDVVMSEKHQDQLEITEHPVEIGAEIADHAYKRPAELTMEVGFAGGGSLLDLWDTAKIGLSLGLSPRETYQKLLELQASRQPFDVITGKRQYSNMLIRAIEVTTDKASENVLMAVLTLRELNMTRTETATVMRQANMREGTTTSSVANTGVKTTKPVENVSLLQRGAEIVNGD
ncbi:hypothetical protein SODG_000143 [Sodalis praecaptivus]